MVNTMKTKPKQKLNQVGKRINLANGNYLSPDEAPEKWIALSEIVSTFKNFALTTITKYFVNNKLTCYLKYRNKIYALRSDMPEIMQKLTEFYNRGAQND